MSIGNYPSGMTREDWKHVEGEKYEGWTCDGCDESYSVDTPSLACTRESHLGVIVTWHYCRKCVESVVMSEFEGGTLKDVIEILKGAE